MAWTAQRDLAGQVQDCLHAGTPIDRQTVKTLAEAVLLLHWSANGLLDAATDLLVENELTARESHGPRGWRFQWAQEDGRNFRCCSVLRAAIMECGGAIPPVA